MIYHVVIFRSIGKRISYIHIYTYIHSSSLFRFFSLTDRHRVLSTVPCASHDCLALLVKSLPASAGDTKDAGSTPGSGRSPGVGNGNPLQFSWEIPWTEEPGGLQSTGSQRNMTEPGCTTRCAYVFISHLAYILQCVCVSPKRNVSGVF